MNKKLKEYIHLLSNLPIKTVYTSNLSKNIQSPFINNILFFCYQNVESLQSHIDMFPIIVCFGFTIDKKTNKFYLKGLNLNYLPTELRYEVIRYFQSLREEIEVIDGEMVEYNAYEVFKAHFGNIIDQCYKKYDTEFITHTKIIPEGYWNEMCRFPIDTFVELVKKESTKN